MSPEEIIERVKAARWNPHAGPEPCIHRDYIDHLLAIHAAAVELLDAVRDVSQFDHPTVFDHRVAIVQERRSKLADLCGWKAEGGRER